MRARPREINIFNMSLLDILCGALGAFCFMMLVALPYYVVGKVDRAKSQERTEELMKDIEKLREHMSDPAQAEDLRKLVEELEAQIKQLQGELNQYAYENDQLRAEKVVLTNENAGLRSENSRLTSDNNVLKKDNTRLTAENDQLTKENEHFKSLLPTRIPFVVMAGAADVTQDPAIFLEDVVVGGETDKAKLVNSHFDPRSPAQYSAWRDDLTGLSVERRGVMLWVSSTTPRTSSYRVFVKYRRPPPEGNFPFSDSRLRPTTVALTFYGNFAEEKRHFTATLTPERFWTLAGTLSSDEEGKLSFRESTEEERDQAWREIMKSEVPASLPTATPGATLGPEGMDRLRKQNQEERRKLEEERLRQQQQASTPAPGVSEEERARRDRAVRERMQNLSPSPSP